MEMKRRPLPGRLGEVEFDGELPARSDVSRVFDELDYQMACQVYLWALPLVSYAHWRTQHYERFGATSSDLVHYVSYRDRLGIITANATTPYTLNFFDLNRTGPLVIELPPRTHSGRCLGLLAARMRRDGRDGTGPGPRRQASHPPPWRGGSRPGRDVRAAGHEHERDVRLPHARSRPSACPGTRRRRPDLPVRATRRPAADPSDLPGRPPLVRRSARRPRLLGAPARRLPARDR